MFEFKESDYFVADMSQMWFIDFIVLSILVVLYLPPLGEMVQFDWYFSTDWFNRQRVISYESQPPSEWSPCQMGIKKHMPFEKPWRGTEA